jgi:ABC-type multidrug transport system ATPase subunit
LLKALSGALPLAAGARKEDDRLRLGIFAQDLAQELPQDEIALSFVASSVREFDPSITEERCRTIMGSLGLVGDKGVRPIGSLSGGEKARVALATFCLTPYNVLLLDEPTNHLDVDAIQALLDALETYEGAVVVISHDRPFCEAISASHVGYVCGGALTIEERELRDADFSEEDKGVRNTVENGVSSGPPPPPSLSPAEAKAQREAERSAQKLAKAAPKKQQTLETKVAEAEAALVALDAEMVSAGADVGKVSELDDRRRALQEQIDEWYVAMEELEAQRVEASKMLEKALNFGLNAAPPPPPPPPPPPAPAAPSRRELARLKESLSQASRKKQKKKKFGKREREEYDTIEADIEALEAAVATAESELEQGNAAKPRLPQMELLALASAASEAHRALDEKMERYLELEEMIAVAEAQ